MKQDKKAVCSCGLSDHPLTEYNQKGLEAVCQTWNDHYRYQLLLTMGASRLNLLHKHEDAHDDALWCTTWVPNNSQCITGSVDECVKVWTVQDEAPAVENSHTYTSHTLGVVSVTVDPTGTFAASSALDSFIRVWNLQVRGPGMAKTVNMISLWGPW